MTLKVPVTGEGPGWIRLAANAINALISGALGLDARTAALEAFEGSATADLSSLDARATDLEAFAQPPFTVASVTLTPAALPGSPVKGMTVYDSTDDKVKTWNGAVWQAHY